MTITRRKRRVDGSLAKSLVGRENSVGGDCLVEVVMPLGYLDLN